MLGIWIEKIMKSGGKGRVTLIAMTSGTLTMIGACSEPTRTTAIDKPVPAVSTPIRAARSSELIRAAPVRERTTSRFRAGAVLPREDDDDRWLRVETVAKDAEGGVATGSFDPVGNQIRIHTRHVNGFAVDTGRLAIDWDRLVVLRINGVGSELRKRDYDVLHFVRDDHGRWEVAEP